MDLKEYEEYHETRQELLQSEEPPPFCHERQIECEYARYHRHREEWGDDYELDCQYGDECVLDEEE